MTTSLSWLAIVRIGLVQTAIGAIVVQTTSTLNRVMVVEIGLPAIIPGLLVTLHYAVQALRPKWGHLSDGGGRRTPWIVGGMALLAAGGSLAAMATALMARAELPGVMLAIVAFLLIGMGVGAAGTSLLTLLAERVATPRRAPAATIVWTMMIAGFAITAIGTGKALDPFSQERLVAVTSITCLLAFCIAALAIRGVETGSRIAQRPQRKTPFRKAIAEVWSESQTLRFTIFIFVSMLAYNAQDLILEPFAGIVYGMTPGQSTQLGGLQHGGVLIGMISVAVVTHIFKRGEAHVLRRFMVGGCLASAIAMGAVAMGGVMGAQWPIRSAVFALGVANGVFSIAAIGAMMAMARSGHASREGVRMGLWGAAQAIAFALGGLVGTTAVDLARLALGSPSLAYTIVFFGEAVAFAVAAVIAFYVNKPAGADRTSFTPDLEQAT